MHLVLAALVAFVPLVPLSAARQNCPLYGPLLPRPTNLLQSPVIASVAQTLDDVFFKNIDNDTSTGSPYFSYAVEVFTGSEDLPLWSHYWTAPNLGSFNSSGVTEVDTNTVFRIGSVTKIFTVLTFLATVGDGIWNDPITKHLPEIAEIAENASSSPIFTPDWESITIDALLGELSQQLPMANLYNIGFPPLPNSTFPPCGTNPTCDRKQLFEGLAKLPPSFAPFTTPAYSDLGFVLLSYVAERITGKPFKSLMTDAVLTPLNLEHTFYDEPVESVSIIPGTKRKTTWGGELGEEKATGNMYTSTGDMSTLGRAILRSSLIKPAMTKRWLKPTSFSSDPLAMVGMPWGIRRIELQQNQTYQFVHTFNKIGSIGSYSSLFALIPELDIGISVLAAGDAPGGITNAIAEALANTYIPTLSNLARAQANVTFSGHYRHASLAGNTTTTTTGAPYSNSTTPPLNSSLTISVDPVAPGLNVTHWLSNGTDMGLLALALSSNVSSALLPHLRPSVRLYPTGLEEARADGGRRVAFKATFEDVSQPDSEGGGVFVTDCATWVTVTATVYGSVPLDLFVFEVAPDGRVEAVVNEGLRVRMERVG
ncbi:beta-lactamase/transpeptidase-like protein [Chaetomium fimeti]|uniref:Beta-lactamase/transpeptidase-like protein n=1 Tax=Chaetomium fimeti TaxID=1854472 RepID=A0AAE0HIJ0_9PEZI|nr:beta-lactamase/transpeptidase-like protein [Chaetomium fimeti]